VPLVISAGALDDPVGVIVAQVAARDPGLDRAMITKVAQEVAGGRAERRRLAQALLDIPGVLADGRSPAPRAVADLLIGLRNVGAAGIAAPGAASSCVPSSAAATTGTAESAARSGNRARPAARSGASTAVTGTGSPGAPSARPLPAAILSARSCR
jgi:hypothetical protein